MFFHIFIFDVKSIFSSFSKIRENNYIHKCIINIFIIKIEYLFKKYFITIKITILLL